MEEQEKQRLIEIAGKYEDCVYIEVSSVQSGSTLVYHLGAAVGIVKPGVHIGMFQDSVLYMKYATEEDPCALDCEFPYKSRVMGTSEPLKPLKAPYMARNPVKWGFFRLKGQEIPLKI